jgi:cysteine desulfurase family protein
VIYLDNAATSFPKPSRVYDEVLRCMSGYCANPGRGGHFMSIASGKAVMETREIICSFFQIKNPMQLCFTKNATEALNIAIKGCLKKGGHAITTSMEHNSVIRPLKELERNPGVELTIVKGNEKGEVNTADFNYNIKSNTKMIICTLSSNVNGVILPVKEIGKIAREKSVMFLVDASQGAGTIDIDVEKMNIDMLAFPGHKGLLGPQGTGGLYVGEGLEPEPLMQGGTGSNSENIYQPEFMPDFLESGTLNTPGIVGLGYGIEFINGFGLENIRQYKHELIKKFHSGIAELEQIKEYNLTDIDKNSGIIALNFEEMDCAEVSYILDKEYGIATRSGLHCAPLAHETLGTLKLGVVRFSVGCFNTFEEINKTVDALKNIERKIKNK